ncbi:XRE family transcriptional regulator [Sphingomonas metalli]|uniref:XRE family transcriptional regulator n=1 Tax=Sphingomonas metalli TaxID=1779358 RepID=UPI003570CE0A
MGCALRHARKGRCYDGAFRSDACRLGTGEKLGVAPKESAARLGLAETRLADLLRGKIDKFSIDGLVDLAATAGLHVRIRVAEAT